jgi:hypothetical protein
MLSLSTATKLKEAGLKWQPAEYDAFFIPFHDLDERVFIISDMSVIVEMMNDEQAITFNGTAEWALDYLILTDAIWVPHEYQLRELLENKLVHRGEEQPVLALSTTTDGYRCTIRYDGKLVQFDDFGASEAYATALLDVLQKMTNDQ